MGWWLWWENRPRTSCYVIHLISVNLDWQGQVCPKSKLRKIPSSFSVPVYCRTAEVKADSYLFTCVSKHLIGLKSDTHSKSQDNISEELPKETKPKTLLSSKADILALWRIWPPQGLGDGWVWDIMKVGKARKDRTRLLKRFNCPQEKRWQAVVVFSIWCLSHTARLLHDMNKK